MPTLGQGLFDEQTGWTRTREILVDDQPDHDAFRRACGRVYRMRQDHCLSFGANPEINQDEACYVITRPKTVITKAKKVSNRVKIPHLRAISRRDTGQ